MAEANTTYKLFGANFPKLDDGIGIRFGMVQCIRDLNHTSCTNCLNNLIKEAVNCCISKKKIIEVIFSHMKEWPILIKYIWITPSCERGYQEITSNKALSKIGWRLCSLSCNIRYENYSFLQSPSVPSPQPGKGKAPYIWKFFRDLESRYQFNLSPTYFDFYNVHLDLLIAIIP